MEEINDLKKRIDHLQYDELHPLKQEVNNIKISISNNDILTKQAIESNEKLNKTMDSFRDTMTELAMSVKDTNRITSQLTDTVNNLNERILSVESSTKTSIDKVTAKIYEIDNKSKFDIVSWCKQNFVGVLLGVGALSYLVHQLL